MFSHTKNIIKMNTEKQAIDQNIPHTATTDKQHYNI
jgi:hypothetical protein